MYVCVPLARDADLEKEYHAIANEFGINLDHKGMVFIGHDNR